MEYAAVPNKYLNEKGIEIRKQKYRVNNWPEYNAALKKRGSIDVWLSGEIINGWRSEERIYDGAGSTKEYMDKAIIACHEIRQVFKLPLRQTEGFINSLFNALGLSIKCPDYTTLSKRLKELGIKVPRYKPNSSIDENIAAIAVDSTGLKRFGRDEWHQEKHSVSPRRSWRKLHIAVDENHYIQASTLTDRFVNDEEVVEELLEQIPGEIDHFTGDGAYDKTSVYKSVSTHSPDVELVIPPAKNAVVNEERHEQRNRNILEISENGRMDWQRQRNYGRRNYSELGVQRYKRILGRAMHAREFTRQKQEAMIGCGVLNKMTSLGMPQSSKIC